MLRINQLKSLFESTAARLITHTKPVDFAKLKPANLKYIKPLTKDTVVINNAKKLVSGKEALGFLSKHPELKEFDSDVFLMMAEIESANCKSLYNLDEIVRLVSNAKFTKSLGYEMEDIYGLMEMTKPKLDFLNSLIKDKNVKLKDAKRFVKFCTNKSGKLDDELVRAVDWSITSGATRVCPSKLLINKAGKINKDTLEAYYSLNSKVRCDGEVLETVRDIHGNIKPELLKKLEMCFKDGGYSSELEIFSRNFNVNKVDETQFSKALKLLKEKFDDEAEDILVHIVNGEKGFNKKDFEAVQKIFSKYDDVKQTVHALDFKEYMGKSVQSLSPVEKREFLDKILSAQYKKKLGISLGDEFAILPKTDDEAAALIQRLIKETSLGKAATFPQKNAESLAFLEKLRSQPSYNRLNENDKKILEIVSLYKGKTETAQNAYEAFYLSEKAGLSLQERHKLYTILKNQAGIQEAVQGGRLANDTSLLAAELRHGNSLELLTFLNKVENPALANNRNYCETVQELQRNLSKMGRNKISLPQSTIPKANSFIVDGEIVKEIETGGIKNIVVYTNKGKPARYLDETGVVKEFNPEDMVNYFHAMSGQKSALDVLSLASRPDSTQMISATYKAPIGGNNKFFDSKGLVLRVPDYNTYISSNRPIESGFGKVKNHNLLYQNGNRADKNELIKAYEKYSTDGKPLESVYEMNPQARQEIKDAISSVAKRQTTYDEALITAPEVQAIFAADRAESFNKVMLQAVEDLPLDLRSFASKDNLPILWMLP